jgi:hypothetical protein
MLLTIEEVFAEEEADIPAGVENQVMEKVPNKLLGAASKKKKRVGRRKA